jgi:hypothetical protein
VDAVFHDEVAGERDVGEPVPAVQEVFRSSISRIGPGGAEAHAVDVHEPAERAFVDALEDLRVDGVVGNLIVHEVHELLLGGEFSGGEHRGGARRVDGHRFRCVNMASGLDGGLGMLRVEARDVDDGDGLDAAFEQAFVA